MSPNHPPNDPPSKKEKEKKLESFDHDHVPVDLKVEI